MKVFSEIILDLLLLPTANCALTWDNPLQRIIFQVAVFNFHTLFYKEQQVLYILLLMT